MRTHRRLMAGLAVAVLAVSACRDGVGPGGSGPWAQVAAGDLFTCALARDGHAWCWGSAVFGQLGSGGVSAQTRPVPVAGDRVFRSLAAGSDHACAIDASGTAWCWGLNDFAELGRSTGPCNATFRFANCANAPVLVDGGLTFDSIVVAGYSTCGLATTGVARCWGWNDHGQVGSGAIGAVVTTPTGVTGNRSFIGITLDIFHACGITPIHELYCWGSNIHGELGADTAQTPRCGTGSGFFCAVTPVQAIAASPFNPASISAGSTHTCVVTTMNQAWCWGSNEYGTLGNPASPGGREPVAVSGGHAFVQLSAGVDHTCAIDTNGSTWCWGLNAYGQLGQAGVAEACPAFGSAKPCSTAPVSVAGLPALVAVSAGASHTCGTTAGGEIWCWGRGSEGQLGDGQTQTSSHPVNVERP